MQKPQKNMRFNALQGVSTAALGYLGIIIASTLLLLAGILVYLKEHGIDLTSGVTVAQITELVVAQRWVFFLGLFLNQAAYLAAGLGMGAYCKIDVIKTFKLNKMPSLRNIGLCVAISLVSLYLMSGAAGLFGLLLEHIGYVPQGLGYEFKGVGDFILGFIVIACIAPLGEELVYRGALQNGLMNGNKNRAVLLSAIAFTLMHANPEQTVYQFLLGLALGLVMLKTQNLWLPIIIHAVNNLVALIFEYAPNLYNAVYNPIYELHTALLSVILLIMTILGAVTIYILIRLMKAPDEPTTDVTAQYTPNLGTLTDDTKNRVAKVIYIMLIVVCVFGWLTTLFSRLA